MMDRKKTRLQYIDAARALAIYFVALGHTIGNTRDKTYILLYAFHMPLFFIISGMVLKRRSEKESIKDILHSLLRRVYSCLVPILIWGILYSVINLKTFRLDTLKKILWGTRESLLEADSLTSLWFLAVLLVSSVICEIVLWLLRRTKHIWPPIACAMVLCFAGGFAMPHLSPRGWPLGLDIALVAAGFMFAGFMLAQLISALRHSTEMLWTGFLILSGMVLGFLLTALPKRRVVLMYKATYRSVDTFLLDAFVLSLFVIITVLVLEKYFPKGTGVLAFVGRHTMGILLLHKPLVKFLIAKAPKLGMPSNSLPVFLSVALIGTVISLGGDLLIGKTAPILLGKRRTK